jgi:hypothetical protein
MLSYTYVTAHEHRARIGLPELGRSILARRVIRRRPFCVISWSTSRSVQLAEVFAAELFASNNTVRTHLRHIYAKLDAHSRSEAVARARELGLLA